MNALNYWAERFYCETCNDGFLYEEDSLDHMDECGRGARRYECETCNFQSLSQDMCSDHMNQYGHWAPKIPCEYKQCALMFHTPQEARRRMDGTNHRRIHFCVPCKKGFQNANNLLMHMNGAAHNANSLCCPFCKRPYTNATGVVHHLESSSCPKVKGLKRKTIYKAISQRDSTGVITNKQPTWKENENVNYFATETSFNGRSYECVLCHKGFYALAVLNQHLGSLAHKQHICHCIGRSCNKEFKAFAPLINHPESESCGATKFSVVQKNLHGILTGQRAIGF